MSDFQGSLAFLRESGPDLDLSPHWSETLAAANARSIDGEVTKLLCTGTNDLDIFTDMIHQMDDFRILLDAALPGEMDMLCAQNKGFHRCAKILEEIAQGIEDGEFTPLKSHLFQHIFAPISSVSYALAFVLGAKVLLKWV